MSTTRRSRFRAGVRVRGSVVGVTAGEGAHDDRLDAVIVGGGASGLSLACHLAAAGWRGQALVIDDDSTPLEVRAWAYWSCGDGLLDPAASPGVDRLWVRAPGTERMLRLARYRYRTITGRRLSATTDEFLTTAPQTRRVRGTVTAITEDADGASVAFEVPDGATTQYLTVHARWVFDSVGPGSTVADRTTSAHLDFVGHHVESDTDAFDPAAPTLMDFRTSQSAGLSFVYVLPTSPRTALVERTRFVVPRSDGGAPDPAEHAAALDRYLREEVGIASYRVTGTELGAIPLLTTAPVAPTSAVVPIGARAGRVRASTGYGYTRIQRHSAAIARSLVRHGHPFDVAPPNRWHRRLDASLLAVVHDEPEALFGVLTRLFAANPPDRVLSFLDEDTSVRDELRLFRTLPVAPFGRTLLRRLSRRPAGRGATTG